MVEILLQLNNKHRIQDIEVERGQSVKYSMTKMVIHSLNTNSNPCSKSKYYGKRACIEEKVSTKKTNFKEAVF